MNVRANKLLLLGTSLGALVLLGVAAYRENVLQEWRRLQRRYQAALPPDQAADFKVQLRQIVIPELDATDRCTSCHVGMAPGETGIAGNRLFAPHPRMPHDPGEFGCTVCHGGQGRATESKAAHGDVHFWPEPMIPREFADAGCGSCHNHPDIPAREALEQGRLLVERNDCLACHKLDGRGGTLRPGGALGMEGPDLSTAGASGFDAGWYAGHLARSQAGGDPRWTASFAPLAGDEPARIDDYLKSRVGAPGLVAGKAMFQSLGCRGCHKVGGIGGDDGPDLTLVGQKDPGRLDYSHVPGAPTLANWFREHFRHPSRVVPGSLMPDMGLSEAEIEALTLYLFSLRRPSVPEALWPNDRIAVARFGAREYARDGATLYGTFCASCHGTRGEGMRFAGTSPFPAVANADFLALATDEFLAGTIRSGRPGRRMPAWGGAAGGLDSTDIRALVAHLRELAGGVPAPVETRPRRWVQAGGLNGERLYELNCARCHGAKGQGGEGVALNNPVLLSGASDSYLVETIRQGRRGTTMAGFTTSSSVSAGLSDSEIEAIVAFLRTWEVTP